MRVAGKERPDSACAGREGRSVLSKRARANGAHQVEQSIS